MEVLKYKTSKEVLIRFCESGNVLTTSRDNILKGLVKDNERSKSITKAKNVADKLRKAETRERAEALVREIKKVEDEELAARKAESEKSALSRSRWYKIVREVRCHTDSDGSLLCGKRLVDRNGFSFQVRAKRAFDRSTWFVVYDKSRNGYWFPEAAIKGGDIVDKCSDEVIEAERMRLKLVNAAKYEADRERRIAMACAYQKNNVEKTRVRNRNRRALRAGAEGSHTLDEVVSLLNSQGNKCACCGVELTESTRELDHIMPLALGGTNYIENLQWMCQFCNSIKSDSHPDEWAIYSASEEFMSRRLARFSTAD